MKTGVVLAVAQWHTDRQAVLRQIANAIDELLDKQSTTGTFTAEAIAVELTR